MSSVGSPPSVPRPHRSPFDPRLWTTTRGVRSLLAASVVIGLGATGGLVVQAVFLGELLAGLFHSPVRLGEITGDLVALAVATLLRALFVVAGAVVGARAANTVRRDLRADALRGLLDSGPEHLAGERTGELTVTLGPGLDAIDAYVGSYLPRLVLAGLAPIVLLGVIGSLDWLSLVTLLVVLCLVPVFMVLVGRVTESRVAKRLGALGALGAHFLDAVDGLPTLRAYGRARRQEEQIAEVTEDLRRTTMAVLRETFLSALVLETLAAVGTALVAVPLALRLIGGHMDLAPALTILVLTPEVFLPLRRASADFHAAADGMAAFDRVVALLDCGRPRHLRSRVPATSRVPAGSRAGSRPIASLHDGDAVAVNELRTAGLRVRYPGRDRPVLERLDLAVAPGERVAVVGPSGAGKSTLLAALVGLVSPSAGRISLGPLDQDEVDLETWRSHFAYMPQRPRLFTGTLADNVRLGSRLAPGPAGDEGLADALRVAQLDELVAGDPEGASLAVGEGGSRLSTGERQRVALARALLRTHAGVVVLDEPTAHLDTTTEARLVDSLDRWLGGRSLVVASHRPGLLGLADRVVSLGAAQVTACELAGQLARVQAAAPGRRGDAGA